MVIVQIKDSFQMKILIFDHLKTPVHKLSTKYATLKYRSGKKTQIPSAVVLPFIQVQDPELEGLSSP